MSVFQRLCKQAFNISRSAEIKFDFRIYFATSFQTEIFFAKFIRIKLNMAKLVEKSLKQLWIELSQEENRKVEIENIINELKFQIGLKIGFNYVYSKALALGSVNQRPIMVENSSQTSSPEMKNSSTCAFLAVNNFGQGTNLKILFSTRC